MNFFTHVGKMKPKETEETQTFISFCGFFFIYRTICLCFNSASLCFFYLIPKRNCDGVFLRGEEDWIKEGLNMLHIPGRTNKVIKEDFLNVIAFPLLPDFYSAS